MCLPIRTSEKVYKEWMVDWGAVVTVVNSLFSAHNAEHSEDGGADSDGWLPQHAK